jgi:stage II sporulation protein D
LLLIVLSVIFLFSCKSFLEKTTEETNKSYEIRVKLRLGHQIMISMKNNIVLEDSITGLKIKLDNRNDKIIIKSNGTGCTMNDLPFQTPLKIYSSNQSLIKINNSYYFGVIKIIPEKYSLEIINYIPIETYLLSVLPSEMPLNFNIEALKAQAVIARTYSYYFITRYSEERNFDVDNTVAYQVYNGFNPKLKSSEINKIKTVLKDTEGMIIGYGGDPILAYFHSNSGGKLRSGKDFFGENSDFPYLVSKKDPYSIGKPNDTWAWELKINDFLKILKTNSDISEIQFLYTPEGFIDNINWENKSLNAKDFRKKMGYGVIKSERFRVKIKDEEYLVFQGIGFGHGVGLSQWGAQSMAEKGFNFREILSFYYPGTQIIGF